MQIQKRILSYADCWNFKLQMNISTGGFETLSNHQIKKNKKIQKTC